MIGGILLLAIAVFAISVLFGGKVENYYKFLVFLIVAPILAAIGWDHTLWFFHNLPFWAKVLCILLLPLLFSTLIRTMFPKAAWVKSLQTFIFDFLVYVVTFPFRFLFRAMKTIGREQKQRLNPYRPVVGNRPPFGRQSKAENQKSNLFD